MAFIPILYRIQEIEIHLNDLNQQQLKIAHDPNLLALESLAKESEKVTGKLTLELSQSRSRIKQIEMELKGLADHVKLEDAKLYSGKISSPRELEQIEQKVSEYRQSHTKFEDELYLLLENEEQLSGQLSREQGRIEKTRAEIQNIQKLIREKKLEIQIEQEEFQSELETLLPQIPLEWLERYRKIAGSHKGIGMAKCKNNTCGACHVSQSDQLLRKLKSGDDQLVYCENCGRILCY